VQHGSDGSSRAPDAAAESLPIKDRDSGRVSIPLDVEWDAGQYVQHGLGHFRTDAVAWNQRDAIVRWALEWSKAPL